MRLANGRRLSAGLMGTFRIPAACWCLRVAWRPKLNAITGGFSKHPAGHEADGAPSDAAAIPAADARPGKVNDTDPVMPGPTAASNTPAPPLPIEVPVEALPEGAPKHSATDSFFPDAQPAAPAATTPERDVPAAAPAHADFHTQFVAVQIAHIQAAAVHHAQATDSADLLSDSSVLRHAAALLDGTLEHHLSLVAFDTASETESVGVPSPPAFAAAAAVEAVGVNVAAAIDGAYSVLDASLALLALGEDSGRASETVAEAQRSALRNSAFTPDGQYVEIDAMAKDGDGAGLLGQLQSLGLQQGSAFGNMAGGLLPIAAVAELT